LRAFDVLWLRVVLGATAPSLRHELCFRLGPRVGIAAEIACSGVADPAFLTPRQRRLARRNRDRRRIDQQPRQGAAAARAVDHLASACADATSRLAPTGSGSGTPRSTEAGRAATNPDRAMAERKSRYIARQGTAGAPPTHALSHRPILIRLMRSRATQDCVQHPFRARRDVRDPRRAGAPRRSLTGIAGPAREP